MTELTEKRVKEIIKEEITKHESDNLIAVYGDINTPKDTKKRRIKKVKRG